MAWWRLVAALACAHGFFSSAPGVRYNTQLAASKDKDCQVFVKNLPWKADSQAVREAMERFGAVVEVRLPPLENDANSHRGYGFVTFAEHTAAEAAVIPADAPQLLGRELLCSLANRQKKPAAPTRGATFAALRRARRRADIERCYEALAPLTSAKEFAIAISAWARAQEHEEAVALLEAMDSAGVEPNNYCYNAAITACEKGKQWEGALCLLQDMLQRLLTPNVVTCNAAISVCEKCKRWE